MVDSPKRAPIPQSPEVPEPALFDQYSETYDAALGRALTITGEQREYYAERRIKWSAACVSQLDGRATSILDFGCGDGANASMLLEGFRAERVVGVDASDASIRKARSANTER